jgi:hypothetical protein
MNTASLGCRGADPEARLRRLCLSLPKQELRSTFAAVDVLTSLKWRGSPPTAALVRRKVDSLTWLGAQDALCFLMDRTIADRHGWLSRHEFDGMTRAVQSFLADTAAEVAHVHARGAVASEEAVRLARNQASHLLRIGLEHRAAARRRGAPLRPIATDRHTLAMAELAKGGEGSEKAALGCLCISDATVLDDGGFVSAAGALLVGTAFCVAATDQVGAGARVAVCCGTCHRAVRGDALTTCRRCGDHLFCAACLAGDGPARHARECERVRSLVRDLARSVLPRVRVSARRVAVVQLDDDLGVIVPMHVTRLASPLVRSSLLEALCRGSTADAHSDVVVYWRLLVAFLVEPEGDAQELLERDGAVHRRVEAAAHAVAEDRACGVRKVPTLRPSEKRRLQKEKRAAERKAEDDARAAAEALAMAEANAVLERQSARPDATSAMLTRVLAKREGAASPDVVARARTQRDALKAAERAARRPAKRTARPERGAAERARREGAEPTTDARSAAARLLLQRRARAWLQGRRKARRKRRSRAAKSIQRAVRAWLRPQKAVSSPFGARVTGVGECKAEPARSDPAEPPPPAAVEGDDDPSCVVCLERPRAVVLLPCRHLSMCALCAAGVSTCPMCRSAVEESMVVFV